MGCILRRCCPHPSLISGAPQPEPGFTLGLCLGRRVTLPPRRFLEATERSWGLGTGEGDQQGWQLGAG